MGKANKRQLEENLESWISWWNEYGHKGYSRFKDEDGGTVYPPLNVSAMLLGCKLPCTHKCAIFQTCMRRKDLKNKEKVPNVPQ